MVVKLALVLLVVLHVSQGDAEFYANGTDHHVGKHHEAAFPGGGMCSECSSAQTCCIVDTSRYSCCGSSKGFVCCDGGMTCCPPGYRCSGAYCVKSSLTMTGSGSGSFAPSVTLVASIFLRNVLPRF
ncbi:Granulins [Folsomia candida]|uniref:Granulins n=1 Tax=Folsomia candida TaxID=158441 RepID=A0A226F2N8_FOLCA|nr:Granulins [Folsomia candida]